MKQIEPVVFPLNLGIAIFLSCNGNDNFNTSININYQLLNESNQQLQVGSLNMTGFDYEAYNTSTDGNEYIYQWSAIQLGVTLI